MVIVGELLGELIAGKLVVGDHAPDDG